MALVTVAATDPGIVTIWKEPPSGSGAPWGEVVWSGTIAIPVKDAADETLFQLTCNFPRNYVYKMAMMNLAATSADGVIFGQFDRGIRVLMSVDIDGVSSAFSDNFLIMLSNRDPGGLNSVQFNTALDLAMYQLPNGAGPPIPDYFLDVTNAGRHLWQWFNFSTSSSLAATVFWRAKAYIYTKEQLNDWPIHYPSQVLPG